MEHSNLEYVGFWPRVGATLIDTILLCVVTFPLLYLIYGPAYFDSTAFIQGPADFIISWLAPAIVVIWLWVARGQTPGKMAIGAKVVDAETGESLSIGKAVVRYLAYFVSAIGLMIGYIWVGLDPKKQGWHDHIAGSVVIRKKDRSPEPVSFGKG